MKENSAGEDVGDPRWYGARILFARGSTEFDASQELDKFTDFWPSIPHHLVRIAGYSDTEEEDSLGWNRAEAVHRELLKRGLEPSRFDKVAGGSNCPRLGQDTSGQDRRVDVSIYNPRVCLNEFWKEFSSMHQVHLRLNLGDPEQTVRETFRALYNSEVLLNSTTIDEMQLGCGQRLVRANLRPFNFANRGCLEALLSPSGHLEDLWIRKVGFGILPLKRSFYANRIDSIRAGMKIEELYALLGRFPPFDYFPFGDRRFVQFCYRSIGTEAWHYIVEASTGVVFSFQLDMFFDRFRFPNACLWVTHNEP